MSNLSNIPNSNASQFIAIHFKHNQLAELYALQEKAESVINQLNNNRQSNTYTDCKNVLLKILNEFIKIGDIVPGNNLANVLGSNAFGLKILKNRIIAILSVKNSSHNEISNLFNLLAQNLSIAKIISIVNSTENKSSDELFVRSTNSSISALQKDTGIKANQSLTEFFFETILRYVKLVDISIQFDIIKIQPDKQNMNILRAIKNKIIAIMKRQLAMSTSVGR